MKTLTVFTPTYNRVDLISRGYEALCRQSCHDFKWLIIDDGSNDNTGELAKSWISIDTFKCIDGGFEGLSKHVPWLEIRYCYKENGGLHTGYNKAAELMDTEICVCIDSDDYMPDDAVEIINKFWNEHRSDKLAGFIGLDYNEGKDEPIGGHIEEVREPIHLSEITTKLHHYGDTKMVIRVDLFKKVAPQPSFPGEKNFNPIYMILKIDQTHPWLTIDKNLCFVDYQETGMAANIFRQYVNSPKSFAALRRICMKQPKITTIRYMMEHLHYVSDKFLAKEPFSMFEEGVSKLLVCACYFPGWLLSKYIKLKAKK